MKTIACVAAGDFPEAVINYCVENEIQTHYQNDIALVEDNGNPFAEWLKQQGYKFQEEDGDYIAILST